MKNRITELFGIKYPIIQAGMVWCSGWELASAVSNAGGLGIIGSGSMYPDILKSQILKCQAATTQNFAVNVPLFYPDLEKHMEIIINNKVPIVFTSAGNPNLWTKELKKYNIKVVHVISNLKFALKAKDAGVDAIVAEGFEAGGHNGIEELTTFCLIPLIKKNINLPLIAAGGIGSGKTMLSAMVLGAEGVQIGSRFVLSHESSAHINFKNAIVKSKPGDTILTLKELTPVRLLKNPFYERVHDAYQKNKSIDYLRELLGRGRAKKGMFEGDMKSGELEIGQISAYLSRILSAKEIIDEIIEEFKISIKHINEIQ